MTPYLPPRRALLTSRDPAWDQHATSVEVGLFEPALSYELLCRDGVDSAVARDLTESLDHLLAAIDHARHRLALGDSLAEYSRTVATSGVYGAALADLRGSNMLTALGYCTVLGPEPIPDSIFDHLDPPTPDATWSAARTAAVATSLAVRRQDGLVVQENVRDEVLTLLGPTEVDRL